MNRVLYHSFAITSFLVASLSGCTKGGDKGNQGFSKAEPVVVPSPGQTPVFDLKEKSGQYGKLQLYTIRTDALKNATERLSSAKLTQLNLEGEFGVSGYQIEGYEIPRTVLIVPKVIFRSSLDGRRPVLVDEGGGLASIRTQFSLFDGTVKNLSSSLGVKLVPNGFQIKNPDGLVAYLTKLLGGEPNFLANVQCPDSITIAGLDGADFNIQLQTPLKSCPTNVFLPTKIVFEKRRYDDFRKTFLQKDSVHLVTTFNFSTPLTVAYAKFNFNSEKLDSLLKKSFPSQSEFYSADLLNQKSQEVIDEVQKSFDQCIPEEAFINLKNFLASQYFSPFYGDDCPSLMKICFRRKPVEVTSDSIKYAIRKEEYFGLKSKYQSDSKLSDSLSDQSAVTLKQEGVDPINQPPTATINNTLRTIQDGDWIELKINAFKQSTYNFDQPIVQNISNKVCLSPFKQCLAGNWKCSNPNEEDFNCRQECTGGWQRGRLIANMCICELRGYPDACFERVCRSYSKVCDRRRVCDRLSVPPLPLLPYRLDRVLPSFPDFAWECTNQTDNQCDPDQWQDQWQRISKYSGPNVQVELQSVIPNLEDIQKLISGITLSFSNGRSCSLVSLNPEIRSSDQIVFQIKNNANCTVFDADDLKPYHGPTLSIINDSQISRTFRCGQLWEDFTGKRTYTCLHGDGKIETLNTTLQEDSERLNRHEPLGIWIPFYPRTVAEAQIRFVGGYFETEPQEN